MRNPAAQEAEQRNQHGAAEVVGDFAVHGARTFRGPRDAAWTEEHAQQRAEAGGMPEGDSRHAERHQKPAPQGHGDEAAPRTRRWPRRLRWQVQSASGFPFSSRRVQSALPCQGFEVPSAGRLRWKMRPGQRQVRHRESGEQQAGRIDDPHVGRHARRHRGQRQRQQPGHGTGRRRSQGRHHKQANADGQRQREAEPQPGRDEAVALGTPQSLGFFQAGQIRKFTGKILLAHGRLSITVREVSNLG